MKHPSTLEIKNYNYDLPQDRIALFPLEKRDDSKLLIYKNGNITESVYRNISREFKKETLLLFNNTRVIEARIFFQKKSGGVIEIFCLEPAHNTEITVAMMAKGKVRWNCLVGGAAKWKEPVLEKKIIDGDKTIHLFVERKERLDHFFVIEFSWDDAECSFGEVLHLAGVIPLPPYLNREAEKQDSERYQTVYAKQEGSVAAPTAGLHFTPQLLEEFIAKSIKSEHVTLHVGAGTFRPVKTETIGDHEMHKEWIQVTRAAIQNILNQFPADIIPVGTTSLRTLESLYWMGVKAHLNPHGSIEELEVKQWDAYELPANDISAEVALQSLIGWMNDRGADQLICHTQLMIAPAYKVKIADAMVTNFHQPGSTLLLLVAALIGEDWKKVYGHALLNDYRFLSYGDGSLLWIRK